MSKKDVSITTNNYSFWRRIEPHSREEDDFVNGLRAEIHDPAWMLARQWQLGEFEGEDAGSPIISNISINEGSISKVLTPSRSSVIYNDNTPLEVYVEPLNLEVPTLNNDGLLSFQLDLESRVKIGLQFEHELKNALGTLNIINNIMDFLKYLASPTQNTPSLCFDDLNDKQSEFELDITKDYIKFVKGRVVDIYKILNRPDAFEILKNKASSFFGRAFASILILFAGPLKVALDNLKQWWYGKDTVSTTTGKPLNSNLIKREDPFFEVPAKSDTITTDNVNRGVQSWNPKSLDYEFAVQIGTDDSNRLVLDASEYKEENLDWYSFKIDDNSYSWPIKSDRQVIPTNLRFSGMPEKRYWNFEDNKINFGSISPKTNNVVAMLLMEFCLIYASDWYIIPINSKLGTISKVGQLKVKDVFGDETLIKPAGQTDWELSQLQKEKLWDPWKMFTLSTSKKYAPVGPQSQQNNYNSIPYFFIPPISDSEISSDRIEEIVFLRDEQANLVWGVEKKYRSFYGEPISGYDICSNRQKNIMGNNKDENSSSDTEDENKLPIPYTLINSVPCNWIPFIPVNTNTLPIDIASGYDPLKIEITLQRAAMIDPLDDASTSSNDLTTIKPSSRILGEVTSPYYIDESEVPRVGSIISEQYRRIVWYNGRIFLWIRRQKSIGSGEGSSGLRFDYFPINKTI